MGGKSEIGRSDCIDATRAYGTIGRLVNHSPNPNVKGRVAVVEGKLRMGFLAMKDLKRGDEVLVDYVEEERIVFPSTVSCKCN